MAKLTKVLIGSGAGVFALLGVPAVASAAPGELVQNGSFESPVISGQYQTVQGGDSTTIPGWTVGGKSIDIVSGSLWQQVDGNQSIDLDGTPGPGSLSQVVSTTPGTTYTLAFELAGNPDGGVKTLTVAAGTTSRDFSFDTAHTTTSNMGWEPETVTFTASGPTTTISFTSTDAPGGNAGPAIDAVSVTANPTAVLPESPLAVGLPLAGIALVGGAVVLRRRRSAN